MDLEFYTVENRLQQWQECTGPRAFQCCGVGSARAACLQDRDLGQADGKSSRAWYIRGEG